MVNKIDTWSFHCCRSWRHWREILNHCRQQRRLWKKTVSTLQRTTYSGSIWPRGLAARIMEGSEHRSTSNTWCTVFKCWFAYFSLEHRGKILLCLLPQFWGLLSATDKIYDCVSWVNKKKLPDFLESEKFTGSSNHVVFLKKYGVCLVLVLFLYSFLSIVSLGFLS